VVTISQDAAELLARIQTGRESASTLRVTVEQDEFVIGGTEPAQDDEICFHEGSPVLRLTAEASKALTGYTVATEVTAEGPTLAILPPDANM
jgi:hypothetical protein